MLVTGDAKVGFRWRTFDVFMARALDLASPMLPEAALALER